MPIIGVVETTEQVRPSSGWLINALSLLLALLANFSNLFFFVAGVATGPIALAFALPAIWRGRGCTRLLGLAAALLAVAAFAISFDIINGLRHLQCPEAPGC